MRSQDAISNNTDKLMHVYFICDDIFVYIVYDNVVHKRPKKWPKKKFNTYVMWHDAVAFVGLLIIQWSHDIIYDIIYRH